MHRYRTHTCGALRDIRRRRRRPPVGLVHRNRDHGGVLFIDLRDHYGMTQMRDRPGFARLRAGRDGAVRSGWSASTGRCGERPAGTENPDLPTGAIEVYVTEIEVLGPAAELPMPVFGEQEYPEETRLKYRFLDLRREKLHRNIMLRGAIIASIRAAHDGRAASPSSRRRS